MVVQNSNRAAQAVQQAVAQLAGIDWMDWMDQEAAKQISPLLEVLVDIAIMVLYQAGTGRAKPADFLELNTMLRRLLAGEQNTVSYTPRQLAGHGAL